MYQCEKEEHRRHDEQTCFFRFNGDDYTWCKNTRSSNFRWTVLPIYECLLLLADHTLRLSTQKNMQVTELASVSTEPR
jgi:hypothetical protein